MSEGINMKDGLSLSESNNGREDNGNNLPSDMFQDAQEQSSPESNYIPSFMRSDILRDSVFPDSANVPSRSESRNDNLGGSE